VRRETSSGFTPRLDNLIRRRAIPASANTGNPKTTCGSTRADTPASSLPIRCVVPRSKGTADDDERLLEASRLTTCGATLPMRRVERSSLFGRSSRESLGRPRFCLRQAVGRTGSSPLSRRTSLDARRGTLTEHRLAPLLSAKRGARPPSLHRAQLREDADVIGRADRPWFSPKAGT
jgi:hypothetical protein